MIPETFTDARFVLLCPVCLAQPGEPCRKRGGGFGPMKTPHKERPAASPCPGCGTASGLACEESCRYREEVTP